MQRGNHPSHTGETIATAPSPLVPFIGLKPAIAYDAKRHQVVLFNNAGQTWLWSGKQWKLAHPPVSPPRRCCTVAAWDPKSEEVVLFGGDGLGDAPPGEPPPPPGPLADTWAWNGSNWVEIGYGIAGPPAAAVAMTYDDADQEMVLLVGAGPQTQTWTLDGARWKRRTSGGGPSGPVVAMAFDRTTGSVLAVEFAAETAVRTWSWDGTRWNRLAPRNSPPGSAQMTLVVDPSPSGLLLITDADSVTGGPVRTETWLWDGHDWALRFVWQGLAWQTAVSSGTDLSGRVWAFIDVTPPTTTCIDAMQIWAWSVARWIKSSELTGNTATSGCE